MLEIISHGTSIFFRPKDENKGLTFSMLNNIARLGAEDAELSGYRLYLVSEITDEHANWFVFEQSYKSCTIEEIKSVVNKLREVCDGIELMFAAQICTPELKEVQLD